MISLAEVIAELAPDWETSGVADDLLVCPHGHEIEQDGKCPDGCVSPLRSAGLI